MHAFYFSSCIYLVWKQLVNWQSLSFSKFLKIEVAAKSILGSHHKIMYFELRGALWWASPTKQVSLCLHPLQMLWEQQRMIFYKEFMKEKSPSTKCKSYTYTPVQRSRNSVPKPCKPPTTRLCSTPGCIADHVGWNAVKNKQYEQLQWQSLTCCSGTINSNMDVW